jgi:hypothetical protein
MAGSRTGDFSVTGTAGSVGRMPADKSKPKQALPRCGYGPTLPVEHEANNDTKMNSKTAIHSDIIQRFHEIKFILN